MGGGLRFYIDGGTVEQHAQTSLAESMSGSICESCGATETIGYTSGWIMTLCASCAKKLGKLEVWELDTEE